MTALMVLAVVFVVLALLAFVLRRRFGVMGLALASGSLLSSMWADDLVSIIAGINGSVATIATAGLVAAGLVVLPALVLLFSGPTYPTRRSRLIGAGLFGLFATVLVAGPLSSALVMDTTAQAVFGWVGAHTRVIVTAGITLAVLDVLAIHTAGLHAGKHDKH